jgi:ABC-type antimicrobial peptide transport system permease subunit
MLSIFGALGLALASVGLFGLLSQAVIERTREFGIRMAIGATRQQIYTLVLRSAGAVAVVGTLAGLLLAILGSRLIEAQLWGVTARSPSIYAAAALVLACVVFIAAAWPARAAMRIEPMQALKAE